MPRPARYTATVTVTDSHGHVTTATVAGHRRVHEQRHPGAARLQDWTAKSGSTVPVKVAYTDCDGSVPTDVDPDGHRDAGTARPSSPGRPTSSTGEWKYELSTRRLPAAGTYTVTVTVPETGQTDTATLTLRR